MESITQSIIAMLAVINPFVCGIMLQQIQSGDNTKSKIIDAIKAMLTVLIILIIAAFAGHYILKAFGISMDAFKIVGGVIISYIGFQMLGSNKSNGDGNSDSKGSLNKLIMFAASPGTIAMVITLAVVHNKENLPVIAIIGTTIAVIITLIIMILMQLLSAHKKPSGQAMFSKFMGLIIVAMGLQFMLTGIKDFF